MALGWTPGAARARRVEGRYARQLRKVAHAVGAVIDSIPLERIEDLTAWPELQRRLDDYAEALEPWARAAGARMLHEVNVRDLQAWAELSRLMRRNLNREIRTAPTGQRMRELLADQVGLIKSIPREAGERVHEWALTGIADSTRAPEVADAIRRSTEVSATRATLIARTEISRTASVLTQARAEWVGSSRYVWRTVGDADVRPTHRKLDGTVQSWVAPPVCDVSGGREYRAHPGAIWNCFPASEKVSLTNGCHRLWRHWYEGPLVIIETGAGRVELTPNHPVLTRRGWIAAEDLQAGDDVVQSLGDRLCGVEDDEHEGQPTFGDVFAALDALVGAERQPGLLFDFHGERPCDQVDQIRTDHLLPGHSDAPLLEFICDLALAGTDAWMCAAGVVGGPLYVGGANGASCFDDALPRFGRHGLHPAHVGLRAGATFDAVPAQDLRHRPSVAVVTEGQRQLALAVDVGSHHRALRKVLASVVRRSAATDYHDPTSAELLAQHVRADADAFGRLPQHCASRYQFLRVIDKRFRDFADHVFTIQSLNGWFTVAGAAVVVKNCRCYAEPILP